MLSHVKDLAMEYCNGDEALAKSFVEGFVKQASQLSFPNIPGSEFAKDVFSSNALVNGTAGAVGKGLGGLAIGLGVHGINHAFNEISNSVLRTKFLESLAQVVKSNQTLQQYDAAKVRGFAETIFKFGPHVATDPNLLGALLVNAAQGDVLDPTTLKTIGDLEARFIENRTSGMFSPKTYV